MVMVVEGEYALVHEPVVGLAEGEAVAGVVVGELREGEEGAVEAHHRHPHPHPRNQDGGPPKAAPRGQAPETRRVGPVGTHRRRRRHPTWHTRRKDPGGGHGGAPGGGGGGGCGVRMEVPPWGMWGAQGGSAGCGYRG